MRLYKLIIPVIIVAVAFGKVYNDFEKKRYAKELFDKEVSLVREGYINYENEARWLAEKYGFSLSDLENALEIGRIKKRKALEESLDKLPDYEPDYKIGDKDKDFSITI